MVLDNAKPGGSKDEKQSDDEDLSGLPALWKESQRQTNEFEALDIPRGDDDFDSDYDREFNDFTMSYCTGTSQDGYEQTMEVQVRSETKEAKSENEDDEEPQAESSVFNMISLLKGIKNEGETQAITSNFCFNYYLIV